MRRQIVADATGAFAERGFFGASMRDIALRVGITEGRLYRYFPYKAGLLDAIVAEAIARSKQMLEAVEAQSRTETDIRDLMQSYARLWIDELNGNHDWYLLWLQRPPITVSRADELNRLLEQICRVVADTIAKRTTARDPVLVATVFCSALLAQTIFRDRAGGAAVTDNLATRVVDGWLAITER